MTNTPDTREIIPAGRQRFGYEHLFPIVRLLIERGHMPIRNRHKYGFSGNQGGTRCALTHSLTDEDWAAITQQFVIPENVVWRFGMIRDHANGSQIQGNDTIRAKEGSIPIEVWEARQDWSDLPADVASAAPGGHGSGPS